MAKRTSDSWADGAADWRFDERAIRFTVCNQTAPVLMDLAGWKEPVTRVVELVGVLLISIGALAATARFLARWVSIGLDPAYRE